MKSVVLKCNNNNNNYNSYDCNNNATSLQVACVAGAWKQWLKERTGARSFSRARFFLCPLLPSACYAGYVTSRAMNDMKAERDLLNSICDCAGFFLFLVGVCRTVLQTLTLFTTKKCHLTPDLKNPYPFSDLAFRQKLCHHYLNQSVNKKNSSNAFRICIFLFRSIIWNENDTH